MPLPKDIETFVQDRFPKNEQAEVLALLENAPMPNEREPKARLLRCVLFASDRTLKGLRGGLDALMMDYRDVILAAEYVRKKGDWVLVWDLSKPFENSNPVKPQ